MESITEKLKLKIEALEEDIAIKNRELNAKTIQLLQTNELLKNIVVRLEALQSLPANEKNQKIKNLINDLINAKNDDFWEQFEATFVKVHPTFYTNLFMKYPGLTANERKLCAFIKMNLSTKDISGITRQTIRSIEMARFRIRKKMELPRSINLSKHIQNF
jgi:glutamate synthase domain-containing protein 3